MTGKDKIYFLILVILIITGWFVKGYAGGIITGFGIAMLLASLLGKALAKKTITRTDKQVKDILVNE